MWACICGVWGETEAERPSQAKDNSVWGGGWGGGAGRDVSVCVGGLACVVCGHRQRQRVTARQRRTLCVCVCMNISFRR